MTRNPIVKLKVWQVSVNFVVKLYKALENLPAQERFGLRSQLQRAAVSIPSNIAEGAARKHTKELIQFLYVARGSISELDTQLEICLRVGYLEKAVHEHFSTKLEEISKMLNGLIISLAKKL